MAGKLAWLYGKRGVLLVVAALAAGAGARFGFHFRPFGFFDGP